MIEAIVKGIELRLETHPNLFSPSRLDRGSLALLSCVTFEASDKILDLGCGYGLVGIYAAKRLGGSRIWMSDNDPLALEFAKRNLDMNETSGAHVVLSNGFHDLNESDFTKIIFNPPFHADFSVPKHFIERGFNRLAVGGEMFAVTKRRTWYANKFASIFGGCTIREIDSYFVFQATKKSNSYAKSAIG